jgi:hypothetical protein
MPVLRILEHKTNSMQSIEKSAAIQQPILHHISDKLNFQKQLRNLFVEQTSLHPQPFGCSEAIQKTLPLLTSAVTAQIKVIWNLCLLKCK